MTVDELIAFEKDIADHFNRGEIKAPIHLSGGNEQQLIDIFKDVGPNDWICTTWRSHFHCLLKNVPPERLKADIFAGKSITLNYPKYRIISSAIVGGILPIALGIAWSIKRSKSDEKVFVFIGDMTAYHGLFYECHRYARGHSLPIQFIIEYNNLSVCTETDKVWGYSSTDNFTIQDRFFRAYEYRLPWPHSGAGVRVNF